MRILIVVIGFIALFSTPAEAYVRRHVYKPMHGYYAPYYNVPRAARYYRNYIPYLAAGTIIGTYFYNRYGQMCHNELVGYDRTGYPVTGLICQ
jgi:hypothetical protein